MMLVAVLTAFILLTRCLHLSCSLQGHAKSFPCQPHWSPALCMCCWSCRLLHSIHHLHCRYPRLLSCPTASPPGLRWSFTVLPGGKSSSGKSSGGASASSDVMKAKDPTLPSAEAKKRDPFFAGVKSRTNK